MNLRPSILLLPLLAALANAVLGHGAPAGAALPGTARAAAAVAASDDTVRGGGAPAVRDDSGESAPAPLLVPGAPARGDTLAAARKRRGRAQYELGRTLEARGSLAAAIAAYRNAVRFDPTIPDANYRMGMLFLSRDQLKEAVRCFDAEVARHPANAAAARELGLGLARLGDSRRAIQQLEALTRRRPNDGDGWQALGYAYLGAKRARDAEISLRRALVLPPARADKHRDLGAVLAARGKNEEARFQYRRAIELDPHDGATWVNLANLERRAGKLEEALRDYREASQRDSTFSLGYQGEIQTLHDLGREDESGAIYRRWLRLKPADQTARLEAMQYFDARGRKDIALEIARDGVRYDDRSGDARLLLGMALEAAGHTRAALAEMRRAEQIYRTPPEKERARRLIAALRSGAADSLRELFASDSLEHATAAR